MGQRRRYVRRLVRATEARTSSFLIVGALVVALATACSRPSAQVAPASRGPGVPAAGVSQRIDDIVARGQLRVCTIADNVWLREDVASGGPRFSGPAWTLSSELAKRLGVGLQSVPVTHETKITALAANICDISIPALAVTVERQKVVDFIIYSKTGTCFYGIASNRRIAQLTAVDQLDTPGITVAYFQGTATEPWLVTRLPHAKLRGVQGAGGLSPIEEILSTRADVAPTDSVEMPTLHKQHPEFKFIPEGDACLHSSELEVQIGMAVAKGQQPFYNWILSVEREIHQRLAEEELKILKGQ